MTPGSRKGLAANTVFVMGAEVLLVGVRLITIFVLATRLGRTEMGIYVGLVSLLQLLAPVSQWGMAHVGVRAIARGARFPSVWSRVTTTIVAGSLLGTVVAAIVSRWIIDTSTQVVVLFAIAQLGGMGLAYAATLAAEAHGRSDVGMLINGIGAAVRIGALGGFVLVGGDDLGTWSVFLIVAMTTWAWLGALVIRRSLGGLNRVVLPTRFELRAGSGFVLVQASATAQNDVDKVILNGFDLEDDAGVYGPGYRIAEMATVPLTALMRASYADFFRRGADTVASGMRYARKLTSVAVLYGIAAGAALVITAPIVPWLLGEEYRESVDVIRLLAFLPLVKGLQYFPGNVLTGADRQPIRVAIILATAALNVIANLALVPRYGWEATVATTLLAEVMFAALLWTAVARLARNESEAVVAGE